MFMATRELTRSEFVDEMSEVVGKPALINKIGLSSKLSSALMHRMSENFSR